MLYIVSPSIGTIKVTIYESFPQVYVIVSVISTPTQPTIPPANGI